MKPFLKWAGNKYRIIEKIKAVLPPGQRYIEPFAGSAAVFLNTEYQENLIADSNSDLINLYKFLQTDKANFIEECEKLFTSSNNDPEIFYQFRQEFNITSDLRKKAMLFIYLNRHCFNGLCRYNSQGNFNTPFGRYKKTYFPRKEMECFAEKAKTAHFVQNNFLEIMQQAQPGDVIYCDPPFVPLSKTSSFTSYDSGGFRWEDQQNLASKAEELAEQGITVVISNHATEQTIELYAKAKQQITFPVQRFISSKGDNRNKVEEILAVF